MSHRNIHQYQGEKHLSCHFHGILLFSISVTCCLGVRPDPGFRFGVGVPESGVGLDRASASGSLCRLDFRVRYLAIGGGCIVGHDGEAVDSDEGDRHE